MKPLTESDIRGLHHELLRYYPAAADYAGSYKTVTNRVVSTNHDTGEERVVLEPAPPGMSTELAMADLVHWYISTTIEFPWALLLATEFMFRFLAIHPFKDGNGRLGRALFLLVLLQSDDTHMADIAPFIAIDRHIEQNKSRYYEVLQLASFGRFDADSTHYQLEPVAWFFLKILQDSLADTNKYRLRYANLQKLSESALLILNSFKSRPEKRLKVAELESLAGLPRRTIQYSLKAVVEQSFIQRTGQGAGVRYQLIF